MSKEYNSNQKLRENRQKTLNRLRTKDAENKANRLKDLKNLKDAIKKVASSDSSDHGMRIRIPDRGGLLGPSILNPGIIGGVRPDGEKPLVLRGNKGVIIPAGIPMKFTNKAVDFLKEVQKKYKSLTFNFPEGIDTGSPIVGLTDKKKSIMLGEFLQEKVVAASKLRIELDVQENKLVATTIWPKSSLILRNPQTISQN